MSKPRQPRNLRKIDAGGYAEAYCLRVLDSAVQRALIEKAQAPVNMRDLGDVDPRARGVLVPAERPRRTLPERWALWADAVAELLSRGYTAPDIANLCGVPYARVHELVEQIRASWEHVSAGVTARRREVLYAEAGAVAERAWRMLDAVGDPREAVALMRLILDAGKRRAELVGADAPTGPSTVQAVQINVQQGRHGADPVAAVAERFGLDAAALAAAGDALAGAMGARARAELVEPETIDVEPVAAGEGGDDGAA